MTDEKQGHLEAAIDNLAAAEMMHQAITTGKGMRGEAYQEAQLTATLAVGHALLALIGQQSKPKGATVR